MLAKVTQIMVFCCGGARKPMHLLIPLLSLFPSPRIFVPCMFSCTFPPFEISVHTALTSDTYHKQQWLPLLAFPFLHPALLFFLVFPPPESSCIDPLTACLPSLKSLSRIWKSATFVYFIHIHIHIKTIALGLKG